jgi:hypothetical protein
MGRRTVLLCLPLLLGAVPLFAREWKDITGTFTVDARLTRPTGGTLLLQEDAETAYALPIVYLSTGDLQYLLTNRGSDGVILNPSELQFVKKMLQHRNAPRTDTAGRFVRIDRTLGRVLSETDSEITIEVARLIVPSARLTFDERRTYKKELLPGTYRLIAPRPGESMRICDLHFYPGIEYISEDELRSPLILPDNRSGFPGELVAKIAEHLFREPTAGKVAKVTLPVYYVTLGTNHGVSKGQLLNVY